VDGALVLAAVSDPTHVHFDTLPSWHVPPELPSLEGWAAYCSSMRRVSSWPCERLCFCWFDHTTWSRTFLQQYAALVCSKLCIALLLLSFSTPYPHSDVFQRSDFSQLALRRCPTYRYSQYHWDSILATSSAEYCIRRAKMQEIQLATFQFVQLMLFTMDRWR